MFKTIEQLIIHFFQLLWNPPSFGSDSAKCYKKERVSLSWRLWTIPEGVQQHQGFLKHFVKKLAQTSVFSSFTRRYGGSHVERFIYIISLLHKEIMLLLGRGRTANENILNDKIQDDCFVMKDAYLANLFSKVNSLNISLRGNVGILHAARDKVTAFKSKIQLYHRRVLVGDTIMFPQMTTLLDQLPGNKCIFVKEIWVHLLAVMWMRRLKDIFQDWMTSEMTHGSVDCSERDCHQRWWCCSEKRISLTSWWFSTENRFYWTRSPNILGESEEQLPSSRYVHSPCSSSLQHIAARLDSQQWLHWKRRHVIGKW